MVLSERELVCRGVGRAVQRLYRAYYHAGGRVDMSEGGVTVVLEDYGPLRFSGTSRGYGLSVSGSQPDERPIQTAPLGTLRAGHELGRYRDVDVSCQAGWTDLIGQRLVRVDELLQPGEEEAAGVVLHFSAGDALSVFNLADEVIVRREAGVEGLSQHLLCSESGTGE